jgi:hypothetical protein
MSPTLTSWKEIAQYVGKGVRTVQRWELEMGLPVRRPKGRSKGVLFALTKDIDGWLYQQSTERSENLRQELERLRAALAEVMAENQVLKTEVESQQTERQWQVPERPEDVVERAARLVRDCTRTAQMYAETIEMSKNLQAIRKGLK